MSQPDHSLSLSPGEIKLLKKHGTVSISWLDGSETLLSGADLRQYCACSSCRANQIVGISVPGEDVSIETIRLMGVAGLQIVFCDGHDRGVFPWGYLRAISEGTALDYLDR